MIYKAFISYSHTADKAFAPALQAALEKFTKPWNRLRALTIFRDETDLGVNPALWSSVLKGLTDSEFFILLASPASHESKWVAREVEYWVTNRERDKILIVLTEGELVWDSANRDFDWTATKTLPECLCGYFQEQPKWADLRWAKESSAALSLSDERFQNAIAELASRLHNKLPRELVGEDLRQHRRALRLARGAAIILGVLLLIAIAASGLFVRQRGIAIGQRNAAQAATKVAAQERSAAEAATRVAVKQRNRATARALAAKSKLMHSDEADLLPLSALLAVESIRREPSLDGDDALRWAHAFLPQSTSEFPRDGAVTVFSPGGRLAASSTAGGVVTLRNLSDGRVRWKHSVGHAVTCMDFSTDDKVAAAGPVGVVTILDAKKGIQLQRITVQGEVSSLAFMPSGAALAVAFGSTVRVFDVTIAMPLATIRHAKAVSRIAFNPDGSLIATGTLDGTTRINETVGGAPRVESHQKREVLSLAFHPKARIFASGSYDGTMRLSRVDSKEAITTGTPAAVFSVAFSPDGLLVAMGDGEGGIRIIKGGEEVRKVYCQLRVISVMFSPDGQYLAASCADKTARVFAIGGEELMRVVVGGDIAAMSFSADSNRLITASEDGRIRIATIERRIVLPPGTVARMALSPQARYVAVTNPTGGALVFDAGTGRQVSAIPDSAKVFKLNFSPDNRYLLVCGETIARIFEVSSGKEVWAIGDGATVAPAISPDGHLVAIGSDTTVWVFDLSRRIPKWKQRGFVQATAIAFSPDGRFLAVADLHARGRVFEAATGKQVSTFPNQTIVGYIAFAPHAHYFAANTGLYETATWQQVAPFARPDIVDTVAFSPDGRYVAAGSLDHTVRIYDVNQRSEFARITHLDQVLIAAFDGTGSHLVTVSGADASYLLISRHPVRTQDLVDDTCRRLTRNLTESEWKQYIGDEPYRPSCPSVH